VRKELVHNVHVLAELREQGAVFVDELDEVPRRAAGPVLTGDCGSA
jgi:4-hydroxy-3-methylbut-2-enyl diphosphate reductase